MAGWIKDYRKELDSTIWCMPPLYHRVWQWLKYKANHSDNEIPMQDGTMFKILSGQHLTSVRNIAKGVGWWEGNAWKEPNPKTIMKILKWLVSQKMISINNGRGNREYTFVTIEKYALYQGIEDEGGTASTPPRTPPRTTAREHPVDINKNDKRMKKNEKKVYAEFVSLTEDEYKKLVDEHGEESVKRMIETLDNYKGANGKIYKSDYRAILNWVIDRVKKEQPTKQGFNKKLDFGKFPQHEYSEDELNSLFVDIEKM